MPGQVQPIDLVAPGSRGLNTEAENTLLEPKWATRATNAVVNRAGRIASRKGWQSQTTTGITGNHKIDVIFEYINESGVKTIISAANNVIYRNITDFSDAANDITSSTAPTADNWQFRNFNGKVLGFQRGHTPIEWSGSGDFTDASYTGTGPDGNCAVAAFGRVWAADADLQTIRYSALLDDTDYSTASGGGTIDMSSIWTGGMDQIVAIEAIGANLVVFGRNHIIIWADGSGSEIGLDPTQLEIVDTVEGTGCIARDSVIPTGEGDLLFLSRTGIQSLGRVIAQKSNPVVTVTKWVRTDIQNSIARELAVDSNLDAVRSAFSPEEGLAILYFPTTNEMYVLDTNHPFVDEEGDPVMPVTIWNVGGNIGGLAVTELGDLYFGSSGIVGRYGGQDDNDVAFTFDFLSGWLDFGPELNHRLKLLKDITATVLLSNQSTLTWKWEFDFSGVENTRQHVYSTAANSQWGEAQYNVGQYSGGVQLTRRTLPAYGEGQFLRLGVQSEIDGFEVVVQQISIAPKIARVAT